MKLFLVLRKETLPIFYDMMEMEMQNSGNIDKVKVINLKNLKNC